MVALALPSDGRVTIFDPRTDIEKLFGEKFLTSSAAEDEFRDSFCSTFMLQHVAGQPPPQSTPEARFNAVACPLRFEANLVSFDGIPTENAIPSSAEKVPFSNQLKIPLGAVAKSFDDESFKNKVALHTYYGQIQAMAPFAAKGCNCCGKAAVAFISHVFMKMPDAPIRLLSAGPTCFADAVFPVCGDKDCSSKLQDFSLQYSKSKGKDDGYNKAEMAAALDPANMSFIQCGYEKCRSNPDTAKLQACSRCKLRSYCCREHQKADWREHKKICKPA